ncbi:hypothetical protein FZC83_09545 [Rossellomorea marisflavi]|uniref:Uncharacterized protein n=1 Tax=Rossellomorea marisflavi TaxID=189381 RepID=A0A5D4RW47_9BACI|nr:hypothetical protein [Rossellomorea marisflavi]TYS55180.1 hypothetical protein FZC83_09545 [Rossellomorea marisflavi]WJV17841.1 hypothetical protein QU593_17110 [Rossellomorea marisflavi]
MKKIKVIESTNLHLNEMTHHHLDLLDPEERKKLREYVMGNKDFQLSHEPTFSMRRWTGFTGSGITMESIRRLLAAPLSTY